MKPDLGIAGSLEDPVHRAKPRLFWPERAGSFKVNTQTMGYFVPTAALLQGKMRRGSPALAVGQD